MIDNVYDIMLNMDGKTNDNMKAHLDLQDIGLRCEFYPQMTSNKTYLPPTCFSMVPKEKDDFLKVLKWVKLQIVTLQTSHIVSNSNNIKF